MSGDVGAEVAAVLYDHREDALTCYDHADGLWWCCICGEHEVAVTWRMHVADALAPLIAERVETAKAEALREAADEAEALRTFAHGKNPTSEAHAIGYGTARRLIVRLLRDRAAALEAGATP